MTTVLHRLSKSKILILTLMVLFISVNSISASEDTVTVQLRWKHQFQFAGFYAAVEKGFYEEEGMVVKLIEASDNFDFAEIVLDGKADFGVESTSILISRNEGNPIVALASIFQHSAESFITLGKYNINSIEDFSGKTALLSMKEMPSTSGIIVQEKILDKVIPSKSDKRIEGLISGEHQVIDGYSIDMPYALTKLGYHPVVISPIKYGIDFYGDCIFTTKENVKKNPAQTAAFLKATIRGWQYAMSHKREVIEIIMSKYSKYNSREALIYEAREMEDLIRPKFVEIGYMHKTRWQHIGEVYVSLGMLDEDFSMDGFLYEDYENERIANQTKQISIFSIVIALLCGTLLIVSIFNRKLRREVIKQTKAIRVSNQQLRDEIKEREEIHANLMHTTKELKSNQDALTEKNEMLFERNRSIGRINEELKLAKYKAEQSDKLKSAFLSNMSHEIRTPMNGIIGFSELLKEGDVSDEDKETYTTVIEENSSQLLRIISDIIDISKIEVGEISVSFDAVNIHSLFDNIYQNFSLKTKKLKQDRVKIKYDIHEGVGDVIQSDKARLMQVLSNLIENAIKFTDDGFIKFSIEKNDLHYVFTVEDTGKGIPEEKVEKVFDRFFKDGNQQFTDMGGTGLGLSIAKDIVELLGGNITLTSQLNKGTQFRFTHPI